uniref:Uncharacterized protein n=1 Tax=Amphimedon queenslandica TaxID=400682 RepID=A0A1X7U2Z3_AMPQE
IHDLCMVGGYDMVPSFTKAELRKVFHHTTKEHSVAVFPGAAEGHSSPKSKALFCHNGTSQMEEATLMRTINV